MPNENQDVEPSSLEETRETIKIERDLCNKINLELLSQCKEHKKILDMRYDDIYKYYSNNYTEESPKNKETVDFNLKSLKDLIIKNFKKFKKWIDF